jgi:hypothetical protein
MSMSKSRLRAEITRLKIEIAALGPITAAAEALTGAEDWRAHTSSEADEDNACEALDAAIDTLCAAVGAWRAGAAPAVPVGWVMDDPAQEAGEVATL